MHGNSADPPLSLAPAGRDDLALMALIAAGDRDALASLYDRHRALLFTLCQRILRDRAEAEQVLLDLFLSLWDRPDRYDPSRGSPLVYLVMLARSRAIDCRRRLQRRQREQSRDAGPALAAPMQDDPLSGMVADEQGQRVQAALQSLDGAQRQAIELAFFEGLSHSEIAARLDRPLGTVKTFIRSGLIRLRTIMRTSGGA